MKIAAKFLFTLFFSLAIRSATIISVRCINVIWSWSLIWCDRLAVGMKIYRMTIDHLNFYYLFNNRVQNYIKSKCGIILCAIEKIIIRAEYEDRVQDRYGLNRNQVFLSWLLLNVINMYDDGSLSKSRRWS